MKKDPTISLNMLNSKIDRGRDMLLPNIDKIENSILFKKEP